MTTHTLVTPIPLSETYGFSHTGQCPVCLTQGMSLFLGPEKKVLSTCCRNGHQFQVLVYPNSKAAIGLLINDESHYQPTLPENPTDEQIISAYERLPLPPPRVYKILPFIRLGEAGVMYVQV